ncbi:MAG: hypothetical protein HYS32_03615 [Candidatus Woesearchaeota archaeon]|nr:MAG: hypothetical protein HYS32_03615 [Candidatus Woesearchaeota archaeon]
MKHLVKREGHLERFDEKKVYASCYSAFLGAHLSHQEAEKLCEKVSKEINKWIKTKKMVNSDQIFKETTRIMKKHHKEAAYLYETHRDIS